MFATITAILKTYPRMTTTFAAGAMFLAVTSESHARCHGRCWTPTTPPTPIVRRSTAATWVNPNVSPPWRPATGGQTPRLP